MFQQDVLTRIVNVSWPGVVVTARWSVTRDIEGDTFEGSPICSPVDALPTESNPQQFAASYILSFLGGPISDEDTTIIGQPIISPLEFTFAEWSVNGPFINPFSSNGPLSAAFTLMGLQSETPGLFCIGNTLGGVGLKGMIGGPLTELGNGIVDCSGITAIRKGVGWHAATASITSGGAGFSIQVVFERD